MKKLQGTFFAECPISYRKIMKFSVRPSNLILLYESEEKMKN